MTISIKQSNLTISVELEEDDFDKSPTCEEVLIAAYEIISRVFSDKSVVNAYYNTDPDTKALRSAKDPIRAMCPKYERR